MVDSILTNQAPIAQQGNNNRSITSAAVSNASSIPEVEQYSRLLTLLPELWTQTPTVLLHPLTNSSFA